MDAPPDVAAAGRRKMDSSSDPALANGAAAFSRRPLAFLILLVALTAAFSLPLFRLFTIAYQDELNSYIVLIPLVAVYVFSDLFDSITRPGRGVAGNRAEARVR